MPKQIVDFTDERNHQWCIHCSSRKVDVELNRDHVPSRSLVDKSHHAELQVTEICKSCNDSFSLDEEYFLGFLSATLSGTTNPDNQVVEKAASKLRENKSLRHRIDKQQKKYETLDGDVSSIWGPEIDRITNVVLKNARGHFYHELGEPMLGEPESVFFSPIQSMEVSDINERLNSTSMAAWGEVGSRWNRRVIPELYRRVIPEKYQGESIFDDHGFAIVQPNVYKFKVFTTEARVDSIIRNYLYTSVCWK